MPTYKATLKLITPNEKGEKLNFKSPIILKEFVQHIVEHNKKKNKQIKILSVTEHSLDVIMLAENVYRDGRDFIPLSNILRAHNWGKYSSTSNLLTTTFFSEINDKDFSTLPVLPKEYDYVWAKLVDNIMDKEQTMDLLKALFVLAETEHLTPELTHQKYANCLYRVKEALYDAFN